jgi:hypothetical protein
MHLTRRASLLIGLLLGFAAKKRPRPKAILCSLFLIEVRHLSTRVGSHFDPCQPFDDVFHLKGVP